MTERGGEREVVTIETFGKSERAWGKVVESSKNIVLYKRTTNHIHNYKKLYVSILKPEQNFLNLKKVS